MKFRQKILLISIAAFLLAASAIYFFIALKGAEVMAAKLKDLTHRDVTIESVKVVLPFRLEIKKLDIYGLLKADYISVWPSLIALLSGRLGINELKIIRPHLRYERHPGLDSARQDSSLNTPINSIFKHISISQGTIDFLDYTVGKEGIKLTIEDILLNLNVLSVSNPAVANFEIKGVIPWQDDKEQGRVSLEGWVDLFKKDMQAVLKIEDIDGIYLYPYYSQWINLENSVIEKARLNFTSSIHGLNNNITAECHLELNDLVFKQDLTNDVLSQRKERMTSAVLDLFKSDQDKIVLDFTHRTKMDNPQFGFANIKGAVESRIANFKKPGRPLVGDIFTFPVKLLEGIVVSTTDLSKAAIDGTFAVGNELKKSLAASFTREKRE